MSATRVARRGLAQRCKAEGALRYVRGCPQRRSLREHIARVLGELGRHGVRIMEEKLESPEAAGVRDSRGSPTLLADGRGPSSAAGVACRLSDTNEGFAGSPSLEQFQDALGR